MNTSKYEWKTRRKHRVYTPTEPQAAILVYDPETLKLNQGGVWSFYFWNTVEKETNLFALLSISIPTAPISFHDGSQEKYIVEQSRVKNFDRNAGISEINGWTTGQQFLISTRKQKF